MDVRQRAYCIIFIDSIWEIVDCGAWLVEIDIFWTISEVPIVLKHAVSVLNLICVNSTLCEGMVTFLIYKVRLIFSQLA